jgi:hypothetical protein
MPADDPAEEPGAELERLVSAEGPALLAAARLYIARAVLDGDAEALAELRRKGRTAEAYWAHREVTRGLANDYGEVKVRAERGLGQIDTEANPRGRPPAGKVQPPLNFIDVNHDTRAGWRKLAAMPEEEFDRYLADARQDQESGVSTARILRGNHRPFVGNNSGQYEWYTPEEYLDAARAVLGAIDLDPASTAEANETVRAARFYTAADDGPADGNPWAGRVWLNPPYSHPEIDRFSERLCRERDAGTVTAALVLVNNGTETGWFQSMATRSAAVCFPLGRLGGEGGFWHPIRGYAAPLQGQAVLYLGDEVAAFVREFGRFGFVAQVRVV